MFMTEKEMNSYRFTSGVEPSEEMLAQIMREVAEDATERQKKATEAYFVEMRRHAVIVKAKWANRIKDAMNG